MLHVCYYFLLLMFFPCQGCIPEKCFNSFQSTSVFNMVCGDENECFISVTQAYLVSVSFRYIVSAKYFDIAIVGIRAIVKLIVHKQNW
jgi:hypothetical protein